MPVIYLYYNVTTVSEHSRLLICVRAGVMRVEGERDIYLTGPSHLTMSLSQWGFQSITTHFKNTRAFPWQEKYYKGNVNGNNT